MSETPNHRVTRTHRPRRLAIGFAAAVFAVVALAGCWSSDQQTNVDLINRARSGRVLLRGDDLAMQKAQAWAEHMARTGKLEHTGGGTKLSTTGLGRWCAVAENVGVGGSQTIVHNAFLGSGPHKANMIGNYDRVGTGVAYGRGQVWVVQIYLRGTC